jgi:hypothetical protein
MAVLPVIAAQGRMKPKRNANRKGAANRNRSLSSFRPAIYPGPADAAAGGPVGLRADVGPYIID